MTASERFGTRCRAADPFFRIFTVMGVGCSVFDSTLKTPLSDRLIYFGRRGILSEAESCSLVRSRLPGRPDNMVEAHPTIAGCHLP
jgi:hypothetical protein